jgi:hypothetical protein
MDDAELCGCMRESGSESAFQTLVERYLGLVHSAALHQVRDPRMSEDVTFMNLPTMQIELWKLAGPAQCRPKRIFIFGVTNLGENCRK